MGFVISIKLNTSGVEENLFNELTNKFLTT